VLGIFALGLYLLSLTFNNSYLIPSKSKKELKSEDFFLGGGGGGGHYFIFQNIWISFT
jgi:hypothetical protein